MKAWAAVVLGLCGCSVSLFSDKNAADTDAPPANDEGPSVPLGGQCNNNQDCGSCAWCNDGTCVEDYCCVVEQDDDAFRCSRDPCWDDSCGDDDTGPGPIPDPTTVPCATPVDLALTTIALDVTLRDVAVLDVDGDGSSEIVTIDANEQLTALRPDGSIVATADLQGHAAHDLWTVDGAYLLVPGQSTTGAYTLARVDVPTPAMFAVAFGEAVAGDLAAPTLLRDLDGDGVGQLAAVVGDRLHTWSLAAVPTLATDVLLEGDTHALEAIDIDADGTRELVAFESLLGLTHVRTLVVIEGTAHFDPKLSVAGDLGAPLVFGGATRPDRLALAVERSNAEAAPEAIVAVLDLTSPAVIAELGASYPLRWAIPVDIDGDGNDEIAVTHDLPAQTMHVYAMNDDGTADCHSAIDGVGFSHPTAADVDGDGVPELIVRDELTLQIWSARSIR